MSSAKHAVMVGVIEASVSESNSFKMKDEEEEENK